ncbi:MAG: Ig-like domain-containing protein, partial [Campylobacterota bacterium]|nr:Ig-like domain-containing protein [Campylobacterota bacterium]
MTTRHLFQSLLLMLFLMLSGCNQSNTSESSTQRDTNFTIALDSKKLHAFTHTPIKVYTDTLSEEITPDVRIKSHDLSIAYYENGEIHTQNPGDTTLTLSYLEREQNLSLHVKENKPLYIQASSNKYSLHSKLSALLSCNAFFDDNISQDITPNVLWSVAPKEYAYIDTNQSYLYALKEGNITITASYQGLSSSFNAIVLNANIEALSLSDTSISLHNNTSHQLQATLHYDDGLKENATTDVTWKSITPQVVSVSHEGMLQAHQRGSSHIEATYNDFTQSIPVEVLHNKINSMLISNQHDALYLFHFDGHSISQSGCFELLARYDDGLTQMIEHDALWQSSHLDILSFGDKNCYQTKGHGDVTVTASKDGVTSTFKTKVTSKELIDLELHTPLSILDKGMRTTLNSYGIDIHGDQYNLAQETFWYSNNQAIASVFNDVYAGELFARNTGDVRIQTQLASMQRSIDLKIDTAALVSLEIIPDINESLPQGYEKNLKV